MSNRVVGIKFMIRDFRIILLMNCSKYVINKEVIWVINSICICDIKYDYLF